MEIEGLNDQIAERFKAETKSEIYAAMSTQQITEDIHEKGTTLWRAFWQDSMKRVNLILHRLWPPCQNDLSSVFAPPIGNLEYIGSTAKGYKGPPKQGVRFNPDDYDIDANLEAPAVAAHIAETTGQKPDKQRYFMRVVELEEFLQEFKSTA